MFDNLRDRVAATFTTRVLLWILGGLLAAQLASLAGMKYLHKDAQLARAERDAAQVVVTSQIELIAQLGDASAAWQLVAQRFESEFRHLASETIRLRSESAAAAHRAAAERDALQRQLTTDAQRIARASEAPDCRTALDLLDAACPSLAPY